MLDPPQLSPFNRIGLQDLRTEATTALNRRAAQEGITLLRNHPGADGHPLLPLSRQVRVQTSLEPHSLLLACQTRCGTETWVAGWLQRLEGKRGSLLVAGPIANNAPNTLGNYDCGYTDWNYTEPGCVNNHTSIVGGLINGGTGLNNGEVQFMQGCSDCSCVQSNFSDIVAAAESAEVSVVVLGLQNECSGCHCRGCMKDQSAFEQEGHDRTSIHFPGNQLKLAADMAGAKPKSLLCVLVHGGSLALSTLLTDCTAIISVWLPGQQGGAAFADM